MLINRKAIKTALLEKAEAKTPGKYTRVSPSVFEAIEKQVDAVLDTYLSNLPDGGKTIE